MNKKEKNCLHCNTVFTFKKKSARFCCLRCQQLEMRKKKFKEEEGMVSCSCCDMKSHDLTKHIIKIHKMSIDDYKKIYDTPTRSQKYLQEQSVRVLGNKNPAYQHDGKFSPLSDKFIHADTTDKAEIAAKISSSNKNNGNTPTTLLYWLKQGLTEEEAKKKLSERQTTFSLDVCIQKHGEIEGEKIWKERQDKWQKTINNKPKDELERISRAKMCNGRGYSKISQELFVSLYERIQDDFPQPYFATMNPTVGNVVELMDNNHYEWFHISKDGIKMFFDFYIKEIKSIIEFDGDYWHGEKRGNQQRDKDRDAILQSEGFRVLHVKERNYRSNPEQTIKTCLEFLNG